MKLLINGEEKILNKELNIEQLIKEELKFNSLDGIAVAINSNIIIKNNWQQTYLNDKDEVEIIHAVQGG